MATSPYFRHNVRSEQDLYESLITESIRHYGEDVYYIPREVVHRDMVFDDVVLSRFKNAYKVETYIESIEGFEGDGDLFQKFGVEIRDAVTFIMSRRRWNMEIRQYQEQEAGSADRPNNGRNTYYRPREGYLIHLPMAGSTFEIMRVEDDNPFFQLGNLPTFRLRCEKFEYSDERFDTEIPEIDRIETFASYQWQLSLDSSSNGFIRGERVLQDNTKYDISGEVVEWLDSDHKLFLAHVGAEDTDEFTRFLPNKQIVGQTSGSVATVVSVSELQEIQTGSPGGASEEVDGFSVSAFEFLDFSEKNPFGDVS